MRRCVEIRRLHGAVGPSVGCSSMDPGHPCWCCDVDGAAPGDHHGVGDCCNHGSVFFFGVRIMLGMNFKYLILWVMVKGQG